MKLRISNALRIISIIVLMLVFFISYAGLPEQVLIMINNEGDPSKYVERDSFFYGTLFVLIFTNLLFYVSANILKNAVLDKVQVMGRYILLLAIIVNIFFSVSLTFMAILNGQENFDYSSYAPFIYLSLGLFVVWVVAFGIALFKSKKMA